MQNVLKVNFSDMEEAIPALTIILMPLSQSIANGISAGILFYVILAPLRGKKVHPIMWILAILVVVRYLYRWDIKENWLCQASRRRQPLSYHSCSKKVTRRPSCMYAVEEIYNEFLKFRNRFKRGGMIMPPFWVGKGKTMKITFLKTNIKIIKLIIIRILGCFYCLIMFN